MAARINASKGGKPDKVMRDALLIAVNRECQKPDGKRTKYINIIAAKLVDKAAEGDVQAAKEIADRIDGRPAQQVALTGADGGTIQVSWEKD